MADFFDILALSYYFAFASLLIVIFVYDLKHKLIPDFATLGILALFVVRFLAVFLFRVLEFRNLDFFWNLNFDIWIFAYDILIAAATLIFFGVLWYFSNGKAMGFGDVKLAPALVLFLGASKGVLAILLSFWIGAIVGIVLMLGTHLKNHFCSDSKTSAATGQKKFTRYSVYRSLFLTASRSKFCNLATKAFLRWIPEAGWKSEIPFGPFLALGAFVALLWGEQLIQFYFQFF